MTLREIRKLPTCTSDLENGTDMMQVHESVFKSYQILKKAKELLSQGTPSGVVLEIVADLSDIQEEDIRVTEH